MRFLRPLPVHVALAMSGRPENVNAGQEIEDPNPVFIEGILKYQSHPYQRDIPALDLVWEKGCSKLFYCPATEKNEKWPSRSVVFLVPSLINRATILDLMADKSFVRWLAGQGHDVYLLDWGDVTEDGKLQNMDDIVEKRLCAAGRNLLSLIGDAGETANLTGLGYCMGGTLLAAAAAIAPEIWGRLVFLASPWDFHAGDAVLQTHICSSAPLALDMIETKGILPMEWIQTVFAAVNGDRGREKFVKFAKMDADSPDARLFVAVEDWLNDGMALPGEVAQQCIQGWYRDNKPGRGQWYINGKNVDPSGIQIRSLVVTSPNDRLVPEDSALDLAGKLPHADVLSVSSGHIGMMTSHKAQSDMWAPLHEWILRCL